MQVVQRTTAYPSYTPGTPGYEGALYQDYKAGLVTPEQYKQLSVSPYALAPAAEPTSAWGSFWEGLSSAGNILMAGYTKYQLQENQEEMMKLEVERQRNALARGMMGEGVAPSYGGINIYTILMFAGIALLAMVMLKKP